MASPSVTLIGPGAIGGSLAGALMSVGHEPTLTVRTPFERLQVQWPDGALDEPAACVTDVDELTPSDVVIVATKATHNEAIANPVRAATRSGSILVVAQNGVDQVDRFAGVIGDGVEIVPAIPMLPCRREGPGNIIVEGPARLIVPKGAASETVKALFEQSFVEIDITDDWTTAAWFKLVLNASSGGVGVLARRGSEVYTDPDAQQILLGLMEEVAAVGRAEGAQLEDDLPSKMLAYQVKHAGSHTASIVVDRLAGVATEWRERNEVVVTRAANHGIAVPLNHMATTLMRLGEPD